MTFLSTRLSSTARTWSSPGESPESSAFSGKFGRRTSPAAAIISLLTQMGSEQKCKKIKKENPVPEKTRKKKKKGIVWRKKILIWAKMGCGGSVLYWLWVLYENGGSFYFKAKGKLKAEIPRIQYIWEIFFLFANLAERIIPFHLSLVLSINSLFIFILFFKY